MTIKGIVTRFDPEKRTGTITDQTGKQHLIANGSFRRSVRIKEGDSVSFISQNLLAGPTAWEIVPEHVSNVNSIHTAHLPPRKFVRFI